MNGTADGYRYFECEERCGLLIGIDKIHKVVTPSPTRDLHTFNTYFLRDEEVYVLSKSQKRVFGKVRWCHEVPPSKGHGELIRCVGIEIVSNSYIRDSPCKQHHFCASDLVLVSHVNLETAMVNSMEIRYHPCTVNIHLSDPI